MLKLTNLSLRRGARLLFRDVTISVYPGQKVGVVGSNGSGKSSLFALLQGRLQADTGEVAVPAQWTIAHVAQETPAVDAPAIEYVMDGDSELRRIQEELKEAERSADGHRQAELHARLETIDGYRARARAARLMRGLGFGAGQEDVAVRELSGGWRMRLNLARALMCRSELLLLDEPTNHLDLDAVIWLEEWLRQYPGTLLLISHDRDFLDRTVSQVIHIENEGMKLYPGNYSDFERRRGEELLQQQSAYEKQQREVHHIRGFVERFRAKASKARQAQSRLKALARMELIAPAHIDSPFHFSFRAAEKMSAPLLVLDEVAAGYGGTTILRNVSLSLRPGDRIGLLGHNGAGKSTLIKTLAGTLAPVGGKCLPSPDLRIGYFAQHQLEQLDPAASPLQHLRRLTPNASEQEMRDFLGGFAFTGDRALAPAGPLSGGEKARLVLALLVYERPHLLLLDEPTNHLDLEMRHALAMALQEFEGAMVIVSHDRHLLRSVCDELLLVAGGQVTAFDGDLEEYRQWLAAQRRSDEQAEEGPAAPQSATARKARRRDEAERRQRLQPLRTEWKSLEAHIEELTVKKRVLAEQLSDPAIYDAAQKERLKALLLSQSEVDRELASTEERWLEIGERIEQAEES